MNVSSRILVLFAHPAIRRSRVNRRLLEAVHDLDGVTVHDLYEAYPDFDIDVASEQQLLNRHEVIVFQHPMYWYSTPAMLKEWQDLVLEHGWAYGVDGHALEGKVLVTATTAGGTEQAYRRTGANHFTIRELLAPVEQTARLCGMRYLSPFVVYGTHTLDGPGLERAAAGYRNLLTALRDGRLDLDAASRLPGLNGDLATKTEG